MVKLAVFALVLLAAIYLASAAPPAVAKRGK